MKKINGFILVPIAIVTLFIVIVTIWKGEFSTNLTVLSLLLSTLFLVSNFVLKRHTANSKKFPFVYLTGTAIQFFSILCIYLALVFAKIQDMRFVLLSLSTLFFIQLLAQAILMIRKVNN